MATWAGARRLNFSTKPDFCRSTPMQVSVSSRRVRRRRLQRLHRRRECPGKRNHHRRHARRDHLLPAGRLAANAKLDALHRPVPLASAGALRAVAFTNGWKPAPLTSAVSTSEFGLNPFVPSASKPAHYIRTEKFIAKRLDTANAILLIMRLNSMTGLATFRVSTEKRNRATAQPRNRATAQPRNRATAQ